MIMTPHKMMMTPQGVGDDPPEDDDDPPEDGGEADLKQRFAANRVGGGVGVL